MTSAADSSRQQRKSLARRWAIAAWRDLDSPERVQDRTAIAGVFWTVMCAFVGQYPFVGLDAAVGMLVGAAAGLMSIALGVLAVACFTFAVGVGCWATDLRAAADEID